MRFRPDNFTDTPVHMTPEGVRLFADLISAQILRIATESELIPSEREDFFTFLRIMYY